MLKYTLQVKCSMMKNPFEAGLLHATRDSGTEEKTGRVGGSIG